MNAQVLAALRTTATLNTPAFDDAVQLVAAYLSEGGKTGLGLIGKGALLTRDYPGVNTEVIGEAVRSLLRMDGFKCALEAPASSGGHGSA